MSVIDKIFEVFNGIITWIASAVNNVIPIFYSSESGLTFVGTLAVVGLGFSVVFLVIGIIQNFLHFRG